MIRLLVHRTAQRADPELLLAKAADLREAYPGKHGVNLDAAIEGLGGSTVSDKVLSLIDAPTSHPITAVIAPGSFLVPVHSHVGRSRRRIYQAFGLAGYLLAGGPSTPHAVGLNVYMMDGRADPVFFADAMDFAFELLMPAEQVRTELEEMARDGDLLEDREHCRAVLRLADAYWVQPWFALRRAQALAREQPRKEA